MTNDLTWWCSCGRTTTSGVKKILTSLCRLQRRKIVAVADEVVILTGTETKGVTEMAAVIVVDAHEKMNGIQVTVKMSGTDATKMIAIQDVMMTAARKILSAEADRHRKENQSPLQKEEVSPPVLAA